MCKTLARFFELRRPRLLMEAAGAGAQTYLRSAHLNRALRGERELRSITPHDALDALLDLEQELEAERKVKGAAYSYLRHIEVLIAVMGEAQIVSASSRAVAAE